MTHFIDGTWTEGNNGCFDVFNPATGEVIGQAAKGGRAEAEAAIAAAVRAFPLWSASTAYHRAALLYKAYHIMIERAEDLARLMSTEQGKPLKAARNEVRYGADFLLWYAEEAKRIYGETIPSARPDQRFMVYRQPVGVVAAITPWNYPVSMITRKLAPALAAGCTAVLKPAEATPLCAVKMFEILEEAGFPAGVVNLVTAENPAEIGEVFTTHPDVAKLTFTGSTPVGRMLAAKAAGNMKRVSMELGGHAPFIVFDDCDPVHAAKGAGLVKFLNTGQACISPNRLFVHRSIAEPFITTLKARTEKMKIGSGLEDGVAIGPLVNEAAIDKIERQVSDALDKGAELVCGGARATEGDLARGHFFTPTILAGVNEDMLIYREETFGPVAPVILFDDEEEVLMRANDTQYGLAAYVYTRDISRAMKMTEGLRFGIVGVNDINPTAAAAPFGGMKNSGLGREGGHEGLDEYLETKLAGLSI